MRAHSLTDAQRQRFSQLVSEGEILSPVEFQRRMGWSAEDVTLAELARRVFALESDTIAKAAAVEVNLPLGFLDRLPYTLRGGGHVDVLHAQR